jgi:nitrogen fixation protein FixH
MAAHASAGPGPTASQERERRTRRIVLWAFAGFVTAVLGANGTMILLAFKTSPGLAVSHAYERGLAYNDRLRAVREREEQGWEASLVLRQEGPLAGELELRLRDREGRPLSRAEVELLMLRPAEAGLDFRLPLQPRGGGRFTAELSFPKPGVWDALVAVRSPGGELHTRERLLAR